MTTFVLALVASTTTSIGLEARALDVEPAARDALTVAVTRELRSRGLSIEENCASCARKMELLLIGGITRVSVELRFEGRSNTVEVPLDAYSRSASWPAELVNEVLGTDDPPMLRADDHRLRPVAWGFLGATLAAATVAVIAGGVALDAEYDIRAEPQFDGAGDPIETRLHLSRAISLVSLAVGVAGLATVALLTWLD